jgi:hypothetical protein
MVLPRPNSLFGCQKLRQRQAPERSYSQEITPIQAITHCCVSLSAYLKHSLYFSGTGRRIFRSVGRASVSVFLYFAKSVL